MGTVYKARHRLMERVVALKIVNPLLVNKPGAVERFTREVKAPPSSCIRTSSRLTMRRKWATCSFSSWNSSKAGHSPRSWPWSASCRSPGRQGDGNDYGVPHAVKYWYDEKALYVPGTPAYDSKTGHYTQMIWRATTEIGCGKAIVQGQLVFVCNYNLRDNS